MGQDATQAAVHPTDGRSRQTLTKLAALERRSDILDRVAAGVRGATINKLLFTETEAAIILGISTESLKMWRREGRGARWVRLGGPGGKLLRYHIVALRDFAAALKPEINPPG
jgi:hypothetical protein